MSVYGGSYSRFVSCVDYESPFSRPGTVSVNMVVAGVADAHGGTIVTALRAETSVVGVVCSTGADTFDTSLTRSLVLL